MLDIYINRLSQNTYVANNGRNFIGTTPATTHTKVHRPPV